MFKKKMKRIFASMILITVVAVTAVCGTVSAKAAGIVTDDLRVMVGYWGMPTEDFVEKGNYHWTELYENLEMHQVAYSFYRDGSKSLFGNGTYGTVIDSAMGFYIDDLMSYAGISLRDINSIEFYTKDVDIGYFTSFTYEELFSSERYYFNDLASYFTVTYKDFSLGEDPKIDSVQLDQSVWNDKVVVKPMLALEDSWVTYELPAEGTAPNFESMGTGNRFRLLFGQATPTEQRTNQTAKYVHTLYVVLNGTPKITDENLELPKQIGSHAITFNVSLEDEAMLQEAIEKLKWSSSDDSVLHITDINMQKNPNYEDAVQVTISYDILKEGDVSINGSWEGFEAFNTASSAQLVFGTVAEGSGSGDQKDADSDTDNDQSGDQTGSNQTNSDSDQGADDADESSDGVNNSDKSNGDYGLVASTDATAAGSDDLKNDPNKPDPANGADVKEDRNTAGGVTVYTLDEQIAELLAQEAEKQEYEQLQVTESEDRNVMPFVGVAAAGLFAAGAGGSVAGFRKRR